MFSRRSFIAAGVSATVGASALFAFAKRKSPAMLSAASDKAGNHFGVVLDRNGNILHREAMKQRCHAAVYNKLFDQAVFFSRRPGNTLFIFSPSGNHKYMVEAEHGFHFYGHGVLTTDHRYLLVTENAYKTGEGVISLRAFDRRLATEKKISSFGIGPHELAMMPDGKTLVVANGGLRTHPEKGRVAHNLDTMQPNISFIDWQTGRLLAQYFPSHNKMSLRHLSVSATGDVYVGVQYQGSVLDDVPLVLKVDQDSGITSLKAPKGFAAKQKHYTASVACAADNRVLVSCPKSHRLGFWNNERLIRELSIDDVAGVCRTHSRLCFSNGRGAVGRINIDRESLSPVVMQHYPNIKWDNHLLAV